MVLTSLIGFLFLFVWWSSFIDKRQQLSSSSALVTPGKQTVCSSFTASLLAWRGPHKPWGQSSLSSLQGGAGAATPDRASPLSSSCCKLCPQGMGHWGVPSNALLCPLLLVCGRIKVRPLGVCPGVVFLHAAVARIAVGMSSSFLGRLRGKWVSALCGQRIEAALSSSWPCWALGTALWLIPSTCFKHRGAHKRQ